ncbi:hypothetical protein B0I32_1495 [Nonomuraea fuscirosea]|uniref:SH3 domain-containing protein n=1 Tax=Nonomuraea fuscirosea TaxID=1291556 RepID=A0A2T0LNQ2_9ACTN|nr:hypothetical protein [Nonomuraea fuscirosea]PRX44877.1 hypothetical protein B0I32_1495 [Nonomuraea fuscirosea]
MFKTSTLFAASVIAALVAVSPLTSSSANATSTTSTTTSATGSTGSTGSTVRATSATSATGKARASACRKIVITGVRVGVREFAFTNGDVLRVRNTGSTLTSCGVLRGNGSNGYADKCGRSGRDWFQVTIPATRNWLGQSVTRGFVPVTCARVR